MRGSQRQRRNWGRWRKWGDAGNRLDRINLGTSITRETLPYPRLLGSLVGRETRHARDWEGRGPCPMSLNLASLARTHTRNACRDARQTRRLLVPSFLPSPRPLPLSALQPGAVEDVRFALLFIWCRMQQTPKLARCVPLTTGGTNKRAPAVSPRRWRQSENTRRHCSCRLPSTAEMHDAEEE